MEKTFQIEGMMCGHCEARVVKAVVELSGVQSCVASAANHQADVVFDESVVQEDAIKQAIEDCGYDVKG